MIECRTGCNAANFTKSAASRGVAIRCRPAHIHLGTVPIGGETPLDISRRLPAPDERSAHAPFRSRTLNVIVPHWRSAFFDLTTALNSREGPVDTDTATVGGFSQKPTVGFVAVAITIPQCGYISLTAMIRRKRLSCRHVQKRQRRHDLPAEPGSMLRSNPAWSLIAYLFLTESESEPHRGDQP